MAVNGAADEDGPPLTELESLQLKANQVTDDSLESTRRMITLCEDSQATGAKTLDMLDQQGEQLARVEGDMDKINAEMKEAEKHITGMEKWCGLCVMPWNRSRRIRDTDAKWKGDSKGSGKGNGAVSKQPGRSGGGGGGTVKPDGPMITRINDDAREDEMEENLQAVGGILSNLKAMSQDMNSELDKQNKGLDRMNLKSHTVDKRITQANQRTEALLK